MAKRVLYSGLLLTAATPSFAAPASAAPSGPVVTTSAKAADPLVRCLSNAEDRTAAAWWFVPRESGGGTFSNLGAPGAADPYFITIADRGAAREIRLEASSAARARLMAAIASCA